jgi:hypothetical protein
MLLFLFVIFFLPTPLFPIDKIDSKVLICGVVKNGESAFEESKALIENIQSLFKESKIIIYENNSSDKTKKLYQDWSEENLNLIFLNENINVDLIIPKELRIGDYRTHLIARARNQVLKVAFSKEFEDFDYLFMIDLDSFEEMELKEIVETINLPQKEWDAVFANGSYDLYALRSCDFPVGPESVGWEVWHYNLDKIGKKLAKSFSNGQWLSVDSAFGGFAIYRLNSIKGCFYSGLIRENILEKLNEYWQKKSFENSCFLTLKELKKIAYNLRKKKLTENTLYTCEHINFHLMMKKKGYNKLFVNPNLIRKSQVHVNY